MIKYVVIIVICCMTVFFCEVCTVSITVLPHITFLPLFIQYFCIDAMSVPLILPIFKEIRYSWISYLWEVAMRGEYRKWYFRLYYSKLCFGQTQACSRQMPFLCDSFQLSVVLSLPHCILPSVLSISNIEILFFA